MNRLIYPVLLLVLGCQSNEIKTDERTYIHDSSFDVNRLKLIVSQIDSVLSDANLHKIDTNIIYISQADSILNIEFKRMDSIEYYLTPHYQVFTNSLGYRLSSKNILTITSHDNQVLRKYTPLDSIVYKTEISSDHPSYVSLGVNNPITSEQSHDVAKYMDFIFWYMTYETDSAFSTIYLDKNSVILEISYQEEIPINKNSAKYFKHTANLISDSVFNGWKTEIRLLDESSRVVKFFHDVDTAYVFSN